MRTVEVAERLKNSGAEVVISQSPAAFMEFVAAETRRWARVVRESNATAD
jgi:tripartite-type tricarboxylate transporter receptor subunit TctC